MSYREPRALPPGQRLADGLPVRTYGPVPVMSPQVWSLRVCGDTESGDDVVIGWEELVQLPQVDVEADLHCVSKVTSQDLRWRGVRAREIVALCPPAPGAEHVLVTGQHGYSATLSLADLTSPRTLVALELDGLPLTAEHGAPARLVAPHLYGYKSVKWLREIEYTPQPLRGFWEQRGYHLRGDAWRQERYSYQE